MHIKTPELLKKIDIPRQKLYYLEQKGYIKPQKIIIGEKSFREYSDEDIKKIECLWKYLKKGFKYRVAYEKALEELSGSQTNLVKNLPGTTDA
ncbi:MAG: MerR family transcriptional regulator [Deltaproteobacteria bacterium]|nr:MerR family transcriptional regulator [Deltaproteobacteria bacterium]